MTCLGNIQSEIQGSRYTGQEYSATINKIYSEEAEREQIMTNLKSSFKHAVSHAVTETSLLTRSCNNNNVRLVVLHRRFLGLRIVFVKLELRVDLINYYIVTTKTSRCLG